MLKSFENEQKKRWKNFHFKYTIITRGKTKKKYSTDERKRDSLMRETKKDGRERRRKGSKRIEKDRKLYSHLFTFYHFLKLNFLGGCLLFQFPFLFPSPMFLCPTKHDKLTFWKQEREGKKEKEQRSMISFTNYYKTDFTDLRQPKWKRKKRSNRLIHHFLLIPIVWYITSSSSSPSQSLVMVNKGGARDPP